MKYYRMLLLFMASLLLATGYAMAGGDAQYRLASGDMIKIHVFGEDDLNMEVRLDSAGVINYPFLGKIRVKGLTVSELENRLISGLKNGYLVSPQVNVSMMEHRPFYIEGEVKKPGGYAYTPGLTVRKAISLAGGFTEFASRQKFKLVADKSSDKKTVGVNVLIRPGDSIIVEKSIFYIDGEVNSAGSFPFHPGMTMREAVSLAGGLTERASESNIVIISKDGTERSTGKADMAAKIRMGDLIHIKQSFF